VHPFHASGPPLTFRHRFEAFHSAVFLQTPIRGSALVTDSEVILDVDLGLLGKLIPEQFARTQIADRAKGLLKN